MACKHCLYYYVARNRMDAGSKANLHMLTKRHSLVFYHEDNVHETLKVVQPSNSTQMTLGDDPPF